MVGCNTSHISNIENNYTKLSLNVLIAIANALNVSVDYLLSNQLNNGFTVEVKTIKRNSAKECYKGLNYEFMEDYIRTHETKETVVEVLSEFEEMLLISQCHSKAFRYPTIKKWFLEKYPEIVQFGMPKEETKTKEEVITTLPKAS